MLSLVIFDVDGTLIDSQRPILGAMGRAFAAEGLEMPPRAEVLGIVGLSLPRAMARLQPELPEARQMALVEAYKRAFRAILAEGGASAEAPFFPGALAAIERLDGAGHLLGIATGKARRGLDRMLDGNGLRQRFVATQTADDAASKPAPEMVLNCLAAAGVAPERCVVVGDTEFDMEMARAAGARAIGVDWGYHPVDRLVASGADEVIAEFGALDAAIAGLIGEPAA